MDCQYSLIKLWNVTCDMRELEMIQMIDSLLTHSLEVLGIQLTATIYSDSHRDLRHLEAVVRNP